MNSKTKVVYHRCGGKTLGYAPNTILTAQWAAKHGAEAIEYDIAIASDKDKYQVFVIEPKLLAKAGLDINNLSWKDVSKINAGNDKFGAQKVPTLEEMLEAVDSRKIAHQIQIKGQHPATVSEVLKRVKDISNYIITAFDNTIIKEIKLIDSTVKVGWLVKPTQEPGDEAGTDLTEMVAVESNTLQPYSSQEISDILRTADSTGVDVILLCGPRLRDKTLVDRVKKAGFEIGAWGVATNLPLAKQLIELGLDRFTLDNPEQL